MIVHHVFNVKTFQGGIVSYVVWAATETYREAVLHKCSYEKMFWKYGANLQENINAEVWLQ